MPKKTRLLPDMHLFLMLLLIAVGYLCIHDIAGGTLFSHDPYDSYTLQAMAWLRGEAFLANGEHYPWLELAIYKGGYYVSFPPVPTLPMLPMTLIFGENTPNNLMVALYAIFAVIGAYRACRAGGMDAGQSCFWALFAVLAGNMMEISTNGGVWLQAQTLHMVLVMWGIDYALRNRRAACLALFALAVGCRPFSILWIPVALYYFYQQDRKANPDQKPTVQAVKLCNVLWPAALIGLGYMWYNWIRFADPFVFGHNYLPEFVNAEYGQFHIRYLPDNLRNIFLRPVTLLPTGELDFPMFGGFMFFIVSPIFIVWFAQLVKDIWAKRITGSMVALCLAFAVNLFLLCLHKSFGGWQFGARYTIDLIPYVFFYLILSGKQKPLLWEKCLFVFGFLFNAYGTVTMRLQ